MLIQSSPAEHRERKRKLQKLTQQVGETITALTTLQCLYRTTNAKIKRPALVGQPCQTTSTGRTFHVRSCSYPYVCRLRASNQITQRSQASKGRPPRDQSCVSPRSALCVFHL